jgi:hypothetical protein
MTAHVVCVALNHSKFCGTVTAAPIKCRWRTSVSMLFASDAIGKRIVARASFFGAELLPVPSPA